MKKTKKYFIVSSGIQFGLIRSVYSNLVVHKGVTNRNPYHVTQMNYKLPMNTKEYTLEVNVVMGDTQSPKSIRRTGIQHRIQTRNLIEQ